MAEQINISIDEEFKDLLRPLNSEEYDSLEESIRTLGMAYDPIILWDNTIIDGHHRYGICTHGGYDYTTLDLEFDSREEAKQWIVDKQAGRRNLMPMEIKYLRGQRIAKEMKPHGGFGETEGKELTELASEEGVSVRTLQRDVSLAKDIDQLEPEVKTSVLKGDVKATAKQIKELVKMDKRDQKKAAKSIQEGKGIEYEDIDAWITELAEPYKNSTRQLRAIRKKMEEISYNPAEGKYVASKFTRIKNNLDEVIDSISQCEPVAACVDCGGEGCNSCYGTGFLSRAARESQDN